MASKTIVAFLGPLGTYSHEATIEYFGTGADIELRPCATIKDTFEAIKRRDDGTQARYALVPLENSTYGPVLETTTLLFAAGDDVARLGRHTLTVRHVLVRKPGANGQVETIYSHEQALGQCERYLRERYPKARKEQVASTAAAAQRVLEDESAAAICSSLAASVYGCDVIDTDIQDGGLSNRTAFLLIARPGEKAPVSRAAT